MREQSRGPRRVGKLALTDLRLNRVEVQRPLSGRDDHAARRERFRVRESPHLVELQCKVVERDAVLGVLLERRPVRELDFGRIVLDPRVVVCVGQIALERGEPVAVPEGLGSCRGNARLRAARIAQHDAEFAVGHRERRVQSDRFIQQRDGPHHIGRVAGPDALRVLPQRLERPRGDLLERVARADRLERLSDALTQPARQPIHGRDDRSIVLGGLAHGDESGAVRGRQQLGGHHVAPTQRIDLATHHGLRALTLGELAGPSKVERCTRRAAHSTSRNRV